MLRLSVRVLAVAVAFVASGKALAETYTWQGASGGSWNEPSNWSVSGATAANVPGASDTAAISGIASIVVNSDASIGGLTLSGSKALTLSGSGKLALGQAETVFNVAAGLTVQCELTGSGKLIKRGAGNLALGADNTFTGGFLGDGSGGDVIVYASHAFGDGKVTINHNTVNIYISAVDLTITNDFVFTSTVQDHNGSIIVQQTGLKLTGTVDFFSSSHPRLVSGSNEPHIGNIRLTSRSFGSAYYFKVITPGNWQFDGQITGSGILACDNAFAWTFNTSGNDVNVDYFNTTGGKSFACAVPNVFCETTQIQFYGNAAGEQSFDMKGHDQVVGDFFSVNNASATYTCAIGSTGGKAILTAKGTANRAYSGKFTGGAGLCWAPNGAYTLTLDASESDTTGTLIASNGTLAVTGTSNFKNLGGIEVYAGASLSFAAGTKFHTRLAKLVLQDGATLSVAGGVELVVGEYYTVDADGVRTLQDGDKTYDLGNGVTVTTLHHEYPAVAATWTAGAAPDEKTSAANNWNTTVDLSKGDVVATFAETGTRAIVDGTVKFKGLVFDAPGITSGANPFYLESANAAAKIDLYESGVVQHTPTSGTRTYDIMCPLTAWTDQLWDLPSPIAKSVLYLREKFVLDEGCGEVANRLEIRGRGKDTGRVTFEGADGEISGTLVVTGANVVVKGTAWKNAGAKGRIEFWDRPYDTAKLTFNNAVIGAPIQLYQMTATEKQYGMDMPLVFADNSTNVFNGKLTVVGYQYLRFKCPSTSRIVFAGGMDYTSYYPVFSGTGSIVVTNKPVSANGWWHESEGHSVLAVPGNCISSGGAAGYGVSKISNTGNGILIGGTSSMTIACDNALAANSWVHIGGSATFDLGGHDVHIGNIRDNAGKGTLGSQFTSATPAILTVSQLVTNNCVAAFTGAAGLKKLGGQRLTMLSTSTSTGTVEVAEGTLEFAAAASWRTASSVTVSGGTIKLVGSSVFGKKTDLHLSSGTLDLANGVRQAVGDLYLDGSGTPAELGLWGAADNASVPANHRTARIIGEGVLNVRGQNPGLVILVR